MLARKLSDEQESATSCPGNSVIVAGPGSGKTTVLSHKISRVVAGLPSYKGVVAISYTNKASDELRDRVYLLAKDTKASFFGTIDKFYIREIVLPFTRHLLGLRTMPEPKFIVEPDSGWEPIVGELGQAVRELHTQSALPGSQIPDAVQATLARLTPLFERGHIHLGAVGALAFLTVLQSHACRRYLKARYSHIFVDEYQDSDFEQHALFMLLSRLGHLTTAVGDLNQSIFGFARKDAKYLQELTIMPGFEKRELLDNHRCHPSIKAYSGKFLGKDVGDPGLDLRVFWQPILGDENTAANWLDSAMGEIRRRFDVGSNSDVAILGRSGNTLTRISRALRLPSQYHVTLPVEEVNAPCASFCTEVLRIWSGDKTRTPELVDQLFERDTQLGKWQAERFLRELRSIGTLFADGKTECVITFLAESADKYRLSGWDEDFVVRLRQTLNHNLLSQAFAPVNPDKVQLYTLHKSKGLEFDVVIHMDLHDYILPSFKSLNMQLPPRLRESEMVQDMNLHYVGLTRAKKAAYLIFQSRRFNSDNEEKRGVRSRFLSEELRPYAVCLPASAQD